VYVSRAIVNLHPARFARDEEPNDFQIHERYFSKIDDCLSGLSLQRSGQFLDMVHTKTADQTNDRCGSIRVFFYLQ
jgi:hypothetical protein